jgi:hypothetical protein
MLNTECRKKAVSDANLVKEHQLCPWVAGVFLPTCMPYNGPENELLFTKLQHTLCHHSFGTEAFVPFELKIAFVQFDQQCNPICLQFTTLADHSTILM